MTEKRDIQGCNESMVRSPEYLQMSVSLETICQGHDACGTQVGTLETILTISTIRREGGRGGGRMA